jgi:membrane-associated phospholipid phosphatase
MSRVAAIVAFAFLTTANHAGADVLSPSHGDKPFSHLFLSEPDAADPLRAASQGPVQPPPEPEHTGFIPLIKAAGSDFKMFPQRRSTWVILGVGAAGAALAWPVDDEVNDHIRGSRAVKTFFKPGSIVGSGWVQAGTAIATYTTGRVMRHAQGRQNKIAHVGFDLMRANIVSQALTYGLKLSFQRDRPTGECCSFPSGHSSATFAAASVLERHFGYRAAWPTFLIAGYVAVSRMHDNRHFLSDVVFGSALGVASGWTVVGRHGRNQYGLVPVKTAGGMMIALRRVSASSAPW